MKETQNNAGEIVPLGLPHSPIEARIFRTMAVATVVSVIASLPFAPWRITSGLLLGGILSLLNHHWLRSSARAAFSVLAHGTKPKLTIVNYVLRYLVISAVVFVAYKFKLVSFVATIAGLCSFVVALFAEAIREVYFAIIHREEIS